MNIFYTSIHAPMNALYKLTIVHYMNPRFDWFNPNFP